ncbi:MAG: helix-turn-helix domain-containing protein [Dermatophilaceae bacterium]
MQSADEYAAHQHANRASSRGGSSEAAAQLDGTATTGRPPVATPGQAVGPVSGIRRLGIEIRRRRRELGLSQRQLTGLLGLSAHSNLGEYERGRRVPPADIVANAESVLGLARGHLMDLRRAALSERAIREAAIELGVDPRRPSGGPPA